MQNGLNFLIYSTFTKNIIFKIKISLLCYNKKDKINKYLIILNLIKAQKLIGCMIFLIIPIHTLRLKRSIQKEKIK